MKKFMHEFKEFALQGNVMSLAVGVIIGAAFQNIITSLTDNILSPIIGLLIGQNFDLLEWHVLGVTLRYGAFITSIINFIIIALVVFLMVRGMNRLYEAKKRKEAAEAPDPEPEILCRYCMTVLHKDATRCPACTSEV